MQHFDSDFDDEAPYSAPQPTETNHKTEHEEETTASDTWEFVPPQRLSFYQRPFFRALVVVVAFIGYRSLPEAEATVTPEVAVRQPSPETQESGTAEKENGKLAQLEASVKQAAKQLTAAKEKLITETKSAKAELVHLKQLHTSSEGKIRRLQANNEELVESNRRLAKELLQYKPASQPFDPDLTHEQVMDRLINSPYRWKR